MGRLSARSHRRSSTAPGALLSGRPPCSAWESLLTSAPFATAETQSWLAKAVFGLDGWLRRWHRVFEYSGNPHCIFRLEITELQHPVVLSDGTRLGVGASVAQLHLWSEQIPVFPSAGATLH